MDCEKYGEELFDSCVKCVKEICPKDNPDEWELYWQLIGDWKKFKERKTNCRSKRIEPLFEVVHAVDIVEI